MTNQTTEKTYALSANPANKKLVAELQTSGARVLTFPQIETTAIKSNEKSVGILNDLDAFEWLIFTDIFAADYFLQAFEAAGKDLFALDARSICAVGEAVADRLRFALIHADVVPGSIEPARIAHALAAYIGENQICGKRFLIVKRQRAAKAEIESALLEMGADVAELEIYAAKIADAARENTRLKTLFAGGAVDRFIFAAPADFISLEELTGRDELFARVLPDAKISATDEVTMQFLRERALKPVLFRRQ